MKRKELLRIPVQILTPCMEELLQSEQDRKPGAFCRAKIEKDLLVLDIYLNDRKSGTSQLSYRIFADRKEEDFITYDTKEQKWRTARMDNLPGAWYCWDACTYVEPEEIKRIEDYLGTATLDRFVGWQGEIRWKQRVKAYGRKAEKWDIVMEKVPQLPKDFRSWLKKEVISEHYLFYEYQKRGKITGWCSRCGKEQVLYKPRYNKTGICKNCGHPVTFKSVGKFGRIWTKRFVGHVLQPLDGGVVVRQFRAYCVYENERSFQTLQYWEERRLIIDQAGAAKAYYRGEYKDGKMHWIETRVCDYESWYSTDNPRWFASKGKLYKRTLPALAKKQLKKTGIWEMARAGFLFSPEVYLLTVKPVIEKAAKAGLEKLALELLRGVHNIEVDQEGPLHQCLHIDRGQLRRLREKQGGLHYLAWLQHEKICGRLDDCVIEWFLKEKVEPAAITFVEGQMKPRQIMNYLEKQRERMPGGTVQNILSLWEDYLDMAGQIGENTGDPIVYRAKDLRKRHDEVVRKMEESYQQDRIQEIQNLYPTLDAVLKSLKKKYEYLGEKYAVLVPENAADLVHEGRYLHHCVEYSDNYYEKAVKGESYILFLRKTDELSVPYYTLEVEPGGTIRQKRTEYNRQNADIKEITEFLERWQRIIAKRMSREDLKLAQESRQARGAEYEKLRKDKITVWEGDYSGHKLVELLEADLMETREAA